MAKPHVMHRRCYNGCTMCQPELFFSHRGSRGHAGRMMAVVGIRGTGKRS